MESHTAEYSDAEAPEEETVIDGTACGWLGSACAPSTCVSLIAGDAKTAPLVRAIRLLRYTQNAIPATSANAANPPTMPPPMALLRFRLGPVSSPEPEVSETGVALGESDAADAVEDGPEDVLLGCAGAVDSVAFALSKARDSLNWSLASTSRYAHPGTFNPAGSGLGKLLLVTCAQLSSQMLHWIGVLSWQSAHSENSE